MHGQRVDEWTWMYRNTSYNAVLWICSWKQTSVWNSSIGGNYNTVLLEMCSQYGITISHVWVTYAGLIWVSVGSLIAMILYIWKNVKKYFFNEEFMFNNNDIKILWHGSDKTMGGATPRRMSQLVTHSWELQASCWRRHLGWNALPTVSSPEAFPAASEICQNTSLDSAAVFSARIVLGPNVDLVNLSDALWQHGCHHLPL